MVQGPMRFGATNDSGADPTSLIATSSPGTLFVRNNGLGDALTATSTGSGQAAVLGVRFGDLTGPAGRFIGPVQITGDLSIRGNLTVFPPGVKSMAMPLEDGSYRRLYTMESPECWIEDFGRGEIVEGRGQVELDASYAEMLALDDYHVFLTPEGDSRGLYVSSKSSAGFTVKEQQEGTSRLTFSYRIVARRKDLVGQRLPVVEPPEPPTDLSALVEPPEPPTDPST